MFTTNSTGFRYIFGYDADHYYDYGSLNQIFPLRIQFFTKAFFTIRITLQIR